MKMYFAVLLISFSFTISCFGQTHITTEYCNIYKNPDIKSKVVLKVSKETLLTEINQVGQFVLLYNYDWLNVKYKKNKLGWIEKKYVNKLLSISTSSPKYHEGSGIRKFPKLTLVQIQEALEHPDLIYSYINGTFSFAGDNIFPDKDAKIEKYFMRGFGIDNPKILSCKKLGINFNLVQLRLPSLTTMYYGEIMELTGINCLSVSDITANGVLFYCDDIFADKIICTGYKEIITIINDITIDNINKRALKIVYAIDNNGKEIGSKRID